MSNTQNTAVSLVRGALLIGFAIVLAWLLLQFTDPSRGADSSPVAQSTQTTVTQAPAEDDGTITLNTDATLSTGTIPLPQTTASEQPETPQTSAADGEAPATGKAPGETAILVLNGTRQPGAAGTLATKLEQSGYDVLTAANAAQTVSESSVYYNSATIAEADARIVATAVGEAMGESKINFSAINGQKLSSDSTEEGNADIIVVIG
jgi:hypothetical protein